MTNHRKVLAATPDVGGDARSTFDAPMQGCHTCGNLFTLADITRHREFCESSNEVNTGWRG